MQMQQMFEDTLKDVYFAERHILKSLPKMIKAAQDPKLKEGLQNHLEETHGQVARLQQVFETIGKRAQAKTCDAILGITEECDEFLQESPEAGPVRDAGLIACGQAVEHYEMSRYGTLVAWAGVLKLKDAASLLEETLEEEKKADALLTEVSKSVNAAAMAAG